jgi:hypothetical protein
MSFWQVPECKQQKVTGAEQSEACSKELPLEQCYSALPLIR